MFFNLLVNNTKLSFIVDLSNRLSYYDLVDNFVFDMNKMVDILWK